MSHDQTLILSLMRKTTFHVHGCLSDLTKIPSHFSFDQLTHFLKKLYKNQESQENIPIPQNTQLRGFYVLRLLNMDILQKWGKNHFQGVKPKLKILVDKSKVT